jgi:hypothetical protein
MTPRLTSSPLPEFEEEILVGPRTAILVGQSVTPEA